MAGNPRKGLTIIELLVVVSIIALLVALLLSAIVSPRDRMAAPRIAQRRSRRKGHSSHRLSQNLPRYVLLEVLNAGEEAIPGLVG